MGAGSRSSGTTTAAAPTSRARTRRAADGSDTTTSWTPCAWSTARTSMPTGPAPVISTRSAGVTPDRVTAWSAIATGSVSAATRVERPSGRRRSRDASASTYRVYAPRPPRWSTGGRRRHTDGRPRRHARHSPHPGSGPRTTRSPTAQPVTSSPTATIVPAHSWPSTDPGRAMCSSTRCRSVPHTPQCETSISTSPGAGSGTSIARTSSAPSPTYTAAGICSPIAASCHLPPRYVSPP